ncbi:accessory gene regulator B family protein [Paenibacillus sp. IB182496]|uniref:Accessory gene regulator B family protein n=1 Tax=Paenibacillus sabuli TaxID=2772509 RepID=A0A927GS68_9BACL|nr:accessory gene regulator B family protein [Paenibacillus sabuli]MBD2846243.1 accessory gene regulator B family protein [Paenibacillus sabuli]
MIEKAADRLAGFIYEAADDAKFNKAILRYALIIVVNFVLTISFVMAVSALFGYWEEVAFGLFIFIILRAISGGYHFSTSTPCFILTTLTALAIPLVPLTVTGMNVLYAVSLVLFILFSPSNLQKQSRIPKKYYPVLKLVSVLFVGLTWPLYSEIMTMAIFTQALTMIHFTFWKGGENK